MNVIKAKGNPYRIKIYKVNRVSRLYTCDIEYKLMKNYNVTPTVRNNSEGAAL